MSIDKNKSKNIAILGISSALIVVLHALAEGLKVFGLPLSFAFGLIPVLVVGQLRGWKSGAILGTVFGLTSFVTAIINYSGIEGMAWLAFNPLITIVPRTIVGIVSGLVAGAFGRYNRKKAAQKQEAQIEQMSDVAREIDSQGEETASEDLQENIDQTISPKQDADSEHSNCTEEEIPAKTNKLARFGKGYLQSAVATIAGVLTNTIGFLGMFYVFGNGKQLGGLVIDIKYILTAIVAVNTIVEIVSFVVIVPAITQALRSARLFSSGVQEF